MQEYRNESCLELKKNLKRFNSLEEIKDMLQDRFKNFSFNSLSGIPHPEKLLNNMSAALLTCESIINNEKIIIVGDYDADGICATCIMLDFFEQIGYEKIDFAMPNRFLHGYGFSKILLLEILENNPDVKLIITVDNGVSSFEAGQICKDKNIKLIITDHHTLEVDEYSNVNIPKCNFLINPLQEQCKFPYKEICGSLVAWYFCCAIKLTMQNIAKSPNNYKMDSKHIIKKYTKSVSNIRMEKFFTLVGIAIISDVMPLNAINHTICKYALKNLPKSERSAFKILLNHLNCTIDSQVLGYKLIPLLNAAGRIDDGKIALYFLRSESIIEAKQYFKQLKDLNCKRKQLQEEVTYKAFEYIQSSKQNPNMFFAKGDDWHEGVLGIVAGKMVEEFNKPCFALTNINGIYKGSGRSYGNVDLISSMRRIGHLLKRYGGHVGAVGLEIHEKNIDEFIEKFEPIYCNQSKKNECLGILNPNFINEKILYTIEKFEPYGNGNPAPKFFIELEILQCRRTAQGFLEFWLKYPKNNFKAMFFNSKYEGQTFNSGDILQFMATLSFDTRSIQKTQIMLIIDKIYGILRKTI